MSKAVLSLMAVALALVAAVGGRPGSHPGMVFVDAGPFVMGCSEEEAAAEQAAYGGLPEYHRACVPRRTLALPGFWIDRTEVTVASYQAFVSATGRRGPDVGSEWAAPYRWTGAEAPAELLDHPVTLVDYDDAAAYCGWRGLALPTEAQWEKAARGRHARRYPWGDRYDASRVAGADRRSAVPLDRIERWTAWWQEHYRGRMRGREVGTFPVGSFPRGASPYRALDMAGNVFEWVDAFFDAYPGSSAEHPEFGLGYRVVRGGDWYLDRIYHQAAARLRAPADHRVPTIGFRCACPRPDDRHPR